MKMENPYNEKTQPWLDLRLTKKAIYHLWDDINNAKIKQIDAKIHLAGNISMSCWVEDKDNWFYENVLKEMMEYEWYKDWLNYYNVHVAKTFPHPTFELIEMWVNYQKQHEFNPPHTHHKGQGYSFVIFMKIPTHWKEQHALPQSVLSTSPSASDFLFSVGVGRAQVNTINIKLSPEDEGRMLFFPAWLQHQVLPFYGTEEQRITLSGNIIPKTENLTNEVQLPMMKEELKQLEKEVKTLKERIEERDKC